MKHHSSNRSTAAIGTIISTAIVGALVVGVTPASNAATQATASEGSFSANILTQTSSRATGDALPNGMVVPMKHFEVSAPFGHSTGVHAGRSHAGIDLSGPSGQRVVSATSGKVVQAGPSGGYGNLVTVQTASGATVLYAHLSKVTVKKGDTVTAGQKLGLEGSTGNSTGPHLHFEVHNKKGKAVNPLKFLGVTQQQLAKLG